MAGPPQMQYRPQQAVQGQFPPVSGPSQPQGHFGYQPSTVYQMGQPSPPVYIVRAPTNPMSGMPQYQAQTFEPRTREKKIIQIKDPNSNKDVTQEILNRHPSGNLTSSTGGTPNTTPDISGQSSSSSTPPLTSQQQAEANVRAQFAAQVAATLRDTTEEKPRKPEYTIQKAPTSNRAEIGNVQAKEVVNTQKEEALKETKVNDTVSNVPETQLAEVVAETQPKEAAVKSQPKEAVQGSKPSEGVSAENTLGTKSLVSSVDATTSANEKIANVRVEIFTADDVRNKESQKSSTVVVSDVVKTEAKEKPLEETEKQPTSDALPVTDTKTLNGPVSISQEEAEETEEVITVESQDVVEAPPVNTPADTSSQSKTSEDQQVAEPEAAAAKETEEPEVLPTASEGEDAAGIEKVNGHEEEVKTSAAAKNPVDTQGTGLYSFTCFCVNLNECLRCMVRACLFACTQKKTPGGLV